MKKLLLFALLFIVGSFMCGCVEEETPETVNTPAINWDVIDCSRTTEIINHSFLDSENNTHYIETEGISNVSITIKNTGNVKTTYVVDFIFKTTEIEELIGVEYKVLWSINECICDSITDLENVSLSDQKTVTIEPDQTAIIYSSCNANPDQGLRVNKWCYEINTQ